MQRRHDRDHVEEHHLALHLSCCCMVFDLGTHRQHRPDCFGEDVIGRRSTTVDVLGYTVLGVDTGLGVVGAAAKATDPAFAEVVVGSRLGRRGVADEVGLRPYEAAEGHPASSAIGFSYSWEESCCSIANCGFAF